MTGATTRPRQTKHHSGELIDDSGVLLSRRLERTVPQSSDAHYILAAIFLLLSGDTKHFGEFFSFLAVSLTFPPEVHAWRYQRAARLVMNASERF